MSEPWLTLVEEWRLQWMLGLQVLLILLVAYVLQRVVARGLTRLSSRSPLPPELLIPVRGGIRWFSTKVLHLQVGESVPAPRIYKTFRSYMEEGIRSGAPQVRNLTKQL